MLATWAVLSKSDVATVEYRILLIRTASMGSTTSIARHMCLTQQVFMSTSILPANVVARWLLGMMRLHYLTSASSTQTITLLWRGGSRNLWCISLLTVIRLADPAVFQSVCPTMFERMLNTVPSDVVLSDIVEPLTWKITVPRFRIALNGSLVLDGQVRVSPSRFASRQDTPFMLSKVPRFTGFGSRHSFILTHLPWIHRKTDEQSILW